MSNTPRFTVTPITNKDTGRTFYFSTLDGVPRFGYSTPEKAQQVVDELNKELEERNRKPENQPA